MIASSPKFVHDCEDCKFIGQVNYEGKIRDVYTCYTSVLARYGDDGCEYESINNKCTPLASLHLGVWPKVLDLLKEKGYTE